MTTKGMLGLVAMGMFVLSAAPAARADATPEEISLRTPPVHQPPGPEYADSTRIFQGIPGLERAPGGRLWATWYGGGPGEGPENYVMLATSGDDGRSWSKVQLVIDPPGEGRAFDPCLWHDPSGRLWLFWAQAYHHRSGRVGTWAMVTKASDAAEPTWSEPRRLCDGIMMNKPTVLASGDWLLPTALWRREGSCRVVRSADKGETFELIGTATVPEEKNRSCDEPMLVEREDGSLLVAGWMPVDEFADRLGLALPEDRDFETVAGLVLHEMGTLPDVGDTLLYEGWRIEIVDLDARRIDQVLVSRV